MADIRTKALTYYREQNLRVVSATTAEGSIQPHDVTALVKGHMKTHLVRLQLGEWRCSCDVAAADCAHRAAVQMATGHRSAAAKASTS